MYEADYTHHDSLTSKNEIKEIITRMASYTIHYVCCSEGDAEEDIDKLLDYITNLQQENERLEQKLRDSIKFSECRTKDWLDYKSRCEKASEYIKEHNPSDIGMCGNEKKYYYTLDEDSVDNLLNILQNGSEEDD